MNFEITFIIFGCILLLAGGKVSCADFQSNVKGSTKNLGGINCLVDTVFNVENTAKDFIYDIQVCNVEESDVVSQLVEYCESLTTKTENIIMSNNNICQNAAYNEKKDAKKSPPAFCASSIRTRMDKLNAIVDKITSYVNKNAAQITDSCSSIAANNLKLNLPIFGDLVGNCAKNFKKMKK